MKESTTVELCRHVAEGCTKEKKDKMNERDLVVWLYLNEGCIVITEMVVLYEK